MLKLIWHLIWHLIFHRNAPGRIKSYVANDGNTWISFRCAKCGVVESELASCKDA